MTWGWGPSWAQLSSTSSASSVFVASSLVRYGVCAFVSLMDYYRFSLIENGVTWFASVAACVVF